ncbi:helix-turn-helix domain-containing protein [Sphingobium boeckii]|uniref:AraC-like DNA-binding protein n=1 Tax=Sphingobium boeckii TaxID=1082345 RepID=A0A7W9EE22_9SPHN|nr:AraC family transcriptional regulator [Sphingobium boeckii]MBB5684231.1 AraC-like DNA-binding protein [Sphingobium boeckii]
MLLSRNYAPSVALAPFIARHYVFSAALPADFELVDRLLAETAFVRILIQGDWAAETAPGVWSQAGQVVFFGSNSRPFQVRCRGPFHVVGIAFRPCGWRALFAERASLLADTMLPLAELWGDAARALLDAVAPLTHDAAIVAACEAAVIARLDALGTWAVDAPMRAFEHIARNDSTIMVKDVSRQLGLAERQLERHCMAGFGHMPKTVLRRSRFLDMAAVMRGRGSPSDDELAGLRYFDQSHRNREFRRFIGMTPSQFLKTPTPLLDAGLELRQLRKAEMPED